MIGVLLAVVSNLASEISTSIGKFEIQAKKESVYTMGFLSYFWASIWFLAIMIYRDSFVFSLASLPTFIPRVILDIILARIAIKAISITERSTFSFIRILTVPFLFLVDMAMGYATTPSQMIGIAVIVLTLIVAALSGGLHKRGSFLVFIASLLAVVTVSLYKYNIQNFNSVEAEQFIIIFIMMLYFFGVALRKGERPYQLLLTYPYSLQSIAAGLASVGASFAFLFASPAVIMGAERSSAILWSVLSGRLYFRERHLFLKLATFVLLSIGLVFLIN